MRQGVFRQMDHSLFSKDEPYPIGKPPRNIANTEPGLKALGALCLFRLNEHFFSQPFSVKKLSLKDKVKSIDERLRHHQMFLVTDHSAFECSMNEKIYSVTERVLYRHTLRHFPILDKYLRRPYRSFSSETFTARIPAIRCSGDYNTSLGNTFVNLCSIDAVCNKLGVKYDCVVEGDDALIGVTPAIDPKVYAEEFTKLGFNIKIDVAEKPGSAGFCSLYWDDMLRPYRSVNKIFSRLLWGRNTTALTPRQLLQAKVCSAYEESPHDPILRHLYLLCDRKIGYHNVGTYAMEQHPNGVQKGNLWMYVVEVSDEAFDLSTYCDLQGIEPGYAHHVLSQETFDDAIAALTKCLQI